MTYPTDSDKGAKNLVDVVQKFSRTVKTLQATVEAMPEAIKQDILGGAGADVDTLKELADLISGNADDIRAIADVAGSHVRYDEAQDLTEEQKAQARNNIGAVSAVGNTNWTDINGKPTFSIVATSGSYNDLSDKPTIPAVPSVVSAFANDAGYLTQHQDISFKANSADLSMVAFSGSYNDLTQKPTIVDYSTDIANLNTAVAGNVKYTVSQSLTETQKQQARSNIGAGTSNFNGSYNSLSDKPTIPTVPSSLSSFTDDLGSSPSHTHSQYVTASDVVSHLATVASTGNYSDLNGKPTLAAVATSGSYDDLTNKPEIVDYSGDVSSLQLAVAGNVKYTVSQTLTDAQKTQARGNIGAGTYSKPSGGIPLNDLASDVKTSIGKADTALQSFTETDPTVPSWAKEAYKPTYTASEVGALPDTTVIPNGVYYGVCTGTATEQTATIDGITEYYDGLVVFLRFNVATQRKATININGIGAVPLREANDLASATSTSTTYAPANAIQAFVYDEENAIFKCTYDYDSNSYDRYVIPVAQPVGTQLYRYKLMAEDVNGVWHPFSTNNKTAVTTNSGKAVPNTATKFLIGGRIAYYAYTTNIAKDGNIAASYTYVYYPAITAGYTFDASTDTGNALIVGGSAVTAIDNKPVYIKVKDNGDGTWSFDSTISTTSMANHLVSALPTTDDGYLYIRIGSRSSLTQIILHHQHPVFWFKDGKVQLYKPTYTASDVGALPSSTVIPTVPTNVSAFTNDAGYLTGSTGIASVSTTLRTIPDRFSDIVNVKDFGAAGDGIADDTSAVTAMINHLMANGGDGYFPAGIYRIKLGNFIAPSLFGNKPFRLRGAGRGVTIIQNHASTQTLSSSTTTNHGVFTFFLCKGISITDMTLDANVAVDYTGVPATETNLPRPSNGCGVYLITCSDFRMERVDVKNFVYCGLMHYIDYTGTYKSYASSVKCENFYINDVLFDGSKNYHEEYIDAQNVNAPNHSAMILTSVRNSTCINTKAINCHTFGLEFKGQGGFTNGYVENCSFINCYVENCNKGGLWIGVEHYDAFNVRNTGFTVSGCTARNCRTGLFVGCTDAVSVSGMNIYNDTVPTSGFWSSPVRIEDGANISVSVDERNVPANNGNTDFVRSNDCTVFLQNESSTDRKGANSISSTNCRVVYMSDIDINTMDCGTL